MAMTETHSRARSSEETRNLYRQKYESQIREWDARVEEFKAGTAKLGAEARLEMQPHIDSIHSKFDAARSRLRDLAGAADDTWEDLKRDAEKAWLDFKAEVEGAYDALKSHHKPSQKN
jgi:hypothetical protein